MSHPTFGTPFGMKEAPYIPDPLIGDLARSSATMGVLYGMEPSIDPSTQLMRISKGAARYINNALYEKLDFKDYVFGGVDSYKPSVPGDNGSFALLWYPPGDEIIEVRNDTRSNRDFIENNIIFGYYEAVGGVIVRLEPAPGNIAVNALGGLIRGISHFLGPGNIDGNIFSANGANLKINNSGGEIWSMWANYRRNASRPGSKFIEAASAVQFEIMMRASNDYQTESAGEYRTDVEPNSYNPEPGVRADVPTNQFTVQVIYITGSGNYVIALGQEIFDTLSKARDAIAYGSLSYEELPPLDRYVRRCYLIVREGVADLSKSNDALFVDAGKFRGSKSGSI